MLKKLIGKSPDYVGKIKDNLKAHHFVTKEVCACDCIVEARKLSFLVVFWSAVNYHLP